MSEHQTTAQKLDVYRRVTDSIITAIETGIGEYRMPWIVRQDRGFSPVSVGSAKPYRGVNTIVLWAQSQSKGYGSALWGTYQQWQSLGGRVRKGEHGSPVVYWGTYESKETEQSEESSRHLFAKGYTVFNLEQVDGCRLPKRFEPKLSHHERIAHAEEFFARAGVKVRDGGNRAYYRPDTPEAVYMPGFDQFPDRVDYYSVLAHESTHWTSHTSRCDRQLGKRFGDDAYRADWRDFIGWVEARNLSPLPAPPEAVAAYIAECAERLKVGSIQRRLNAISEAHKAVGLESPTHSTLVRNTLKGIRRIKGTSPNQKAAALTDDIRAMVSATDAGLIGVRDRALILLGFAGAFRRSELVSLAAGDCVFGKDGLTVLLRRSKTDQAGEGRKIGIPYGSNPETCPVRTLQTWIEQAGISEGAVFRSINRHGRLLVSSLAGIDVARIVKKLALRTSLDPAKYAGHSLRAGHATSAAIAGASERSIMNQTGHRSVQMVRRYIREGNLFRENSAGKLGL